MCHRRSFVAGIYTAGRVCTGNLSRNFDWGGKMEYIKAFFVGGLLCVIGQLLIDKTKLTPARILVMYVVGGVILSAFGVYQNIVDWAGAGATVPLTGFGHTLATGVREAVDEFGFIGILIGGIKSTAGGITGAILIGFLAAVIFTPKDKA